MATPRARVIATVIARLGIPPRCDTCGFPERDAQQCVTLYEGEDIGQCEACGNMLDQFGRPVGDGTMEPMVVRLVGADRATWAPKSAAAVDARA